MEKDGIQAKFRLKKEGLYLEKKDRERAIDFYKKLIVNSLFLNDYYVYRRLAMLYNKEKDYQNEYFVIKYFLNSGIYCSNYQFLWFINKLKELSKKGIVDEEEIEQLKETFKTNSLKNKDKANVPVIIADRIKSKKGYIKVISKRNYDRDQKMYEMEEIAREYKREGKYDGAIHVLEEMIYKKKFKSYRYYNDLCILYRKVGDYDSELRVINEYRMGNATQTDYSDELFEKRYKQVQELIANRNNDNSGSVSAESEDSKSESDSISNKSNIKFERGISATKSLGIEKEYSDSFKLLKEYEVDLEKPLNFHQFDESLTEEENVNRKFYLKEWGKALYKEKRNDEAIEFYQSLKQNSYFINDYYPYRQLCLVYKRTKDYDAYLNNIKELFKSEIYLNSYQHTWFVHKIKQLRDHISVNEEEIASLLEYYEEHGAKMQENVNIPIALADRIVKIRNKIKLKSIESYDMSQEIYSIEETGRILEKEENYEMAIAFYKDKIKEGFDLYKFYQRICFCFEKLEDYEKELDWIANYFQNPPKNASDSSNDWFEKRLKKVNSKLDANYTVENLKI